MGNSYAISRRDPRRKNGHGLRQLIYECEDCGRKVDEDTLDNAKDPDKQDR